MQPFCGGATKSVAINVDYIILEVRSSTSYERQGRLIDQDEAAFIKREGYF
jgi:hypothetical protein